MNHVSKNSLSNLLISQLF